MNWKDKIVVITGASSGIGAEMAIRMAEKGAIPVLIGRSVERLRDVSAKLKGTHETMQVDVQDTEAVAEAMTMIERKYGKIDVLVNNAGFGVFETFLEAPIERFASMMDVNYMGVVRCTKAVLPGMIRRGQGRIVNVASIAGKVGTAKSSGYSATKHAVLGLTNSLRQELARTGVKVTAINPGPIDTPFFKSADPTGNYARSVKGFMLRPEQVADAVIRAVEKGTREKNLPALFAFGATLSHLFPRLFEWISIRFLNKK